MELLELCQRIRLSNAMTGRILSAAREIPHGILTGAAVGLFAPGTWSQALEQVRKELGDDPDGVKILTLMLLCSEKTREFYRVHRISEEIFWDTFAVFSRFVREHTVSYGREGFDRWWWTVRQLSGTLFRVGTLEYELPDAPGGTIRIHIPSDAVLTREHLRDSWLRGRKLMEEAFPEYAGAAMGCESWLLSPQLPDFLPESSGILLFQRGFRITGTLPSDDIREWVFKNPKLPTEALPESTSLQRKLKAFLLAGGVFCNGEGLLNDDPWNG